MKAKRISQKAVRSMINSNTVLLHICNFRRRERTNLRRAVDECVYASRLYNNKEFLKYSQLSIDKTSKYYTLVISGMQFLIVSALGWCNIYQVFEAKGDNKEYKLTVEFRNGQICCYLGKTKKQAIAEFKRDFGSFRGFVRKEWEIIINN